MLKITFKLKLYVCVYLLAVSCTGGLFSTNFRGNVADEAGNSFIIVEQNDYSFAALAGKQLVNTAAFIIFPANGEFALRVGAGVKDINLYFIKEFHKIEVYNYSRLSNITNTKASVEFVPVDNWLDYYYFYLKPYLTKYITIEEYRLPSHDIAYIKRWIDQVEAKF